MKRIRETLLVLVTMLVPLHAQQGTPISVREALGDVLVRVQADVAPDAFITDAFFIEFNYQGAAWSLDIQTGKATGWIYRCYSPGFDSVQFYGAVKPAASIQLFQIQGDTLSHYLPVNVGTGGLIEPWIDSPEALQVSKNGGAAPFLQAHPEARISLACVFFNPVANAVAPVGIYWYLRYLSSTDTMTCVVHADTGDPYRCISSNAPRITSVAKTLARANEPYVYEVKANGVPPVQFQLVTSPTGMAIDQASGMVTWTPAAGQVGTHAVTVRAENAFGSDEQSFQVLVQSPATAPVITSLPPLEAKAGETYVYQLTTTGAPAPKFQLLSSPQGMLIDSGRGTVIWTPTRAQTGDFTVRVRAYNTAGVDSQRYMLTVYSTPKFQTIGDHNATEGVQFSVKIAADGFPAPTYFLVSPPVGMMLDSTTGILTWTPTANQVGVNTIFVQARNRVGLQQVSFPITVSPLDAVDDPFPSNITLSQNYPNPVRSNLASIDFTLPQGEWYRLTLLDVLGTNLTQLAEGRARQTGNSLRLDLGEFRNGVYFIALDTPAGTVRRAMIISR